MKKLFILTVLLTVFISCKNNDNKKAEGGDEFESFVVKEMLPAGGYVYLLGEHGDDLTWYALTAREVKVGDVYYYTEPLVMKDFYSKELDRPFDEVLFLMNASTEPADLKSAAPADANPAQENVMSGKPSGKITTEKQQLSIEVPANGITIAQLYENAKQYNGKKVIVRGEVVKFSPEIMNTNWVHLQDGTSFDGKYDLTITTDQVVNIEDIVTFEGMVTLDKDFGYGYFYEILLEGAVVVK